MVGINSEFKPYGLLIKYWYRSYCTWLDISFSFLYWNSFYDI